jgi:hypothetical protein
MTRHPSTHPGRWLPLALATLLAACSGGEGGGGGGGPTDPVPTVTVVASPSAIGATGSSQISIQVTGTAAAGLVLELTATVGRLDQTELVTNLQGGASTFLRGTGTTGVSTVRAQVRGAGTSGTAEVRVGLDRTLQLDVQPAAIAGSERAAVVVTVFAPDGTPAPARLPVTLSTTLGILGATTLETDASGVARTTLDTNGQVGTARVTATVSGGARSVTADVLLRPAFAVRVFADPEAIDSSGRSTITVRVDVIDPNARPGGLSVQLTSTLGRLETSPVRTNSAGVATSVLRAEGATGIATVTATLAGFAPATTQVAIGGALQVQLTVTPASIDRTGTATVRAVVSRPDGSAAPVGTQVRVETSLGRVDDDRLETDGLGVASTTLRGDNRTGNATVTVTIVGTSTRASQTITFT